MKVVFLLFNLSRICGLIQTQYKKLSLDNTEWPVYISKTVPFMTNGNIECGAICNAQFDGGCDMYSPHKETKRCHIGYFDNTESDYLTGQEGDHSVYLSLSKKVLIIQLCRMKMAPIVIKHY